MSHWTIISMDGGQVLASLVGLCALLSAYETHVLSWDGVISFVNIMTSIRASTLLGYYKVENEYIDSRVFSDANNSSVNCPRGPERNWDGPCFSPPPIFLPGVVTHRAWDPNTLTHLSKATAAAGERQCWVCHPNPQLGKDTLSPASPLPGSPTNG